VCGSVNECIFDSMGEESNGGGTEKGRSEQGLGVIRGNAVYSVDGGKLIVKETMKSE
jgi:hypothetical protein